MRWSTREIEYIDVFASSIAMGWLSYYRAMHLLTAVKPLENRTLEAIRTKLQWRVRKFREETGL